jgi:cell division protein FtsL
MTERFIHTNYLARQKVQGPKAREQVLPLGVVVTGLLAMLAVFCVLWVRIYSIDIGYRISETVESGKTLREQNHQLRIARASLIAPARIENIARKQLNMIEPETAQVITLIW